MHASVYPTVVPPYFGTRPVLDGLPEFCDVRHADQRFIAR